MSSSRDKSSKADKFMVKAKKSFEKLKPRRTSDKSRDVRSSASTSTPGSPPVSDARPSLPDATHGPLTRVTSSGRAYDSPSDAQGGITRTTRVSLHRTESTDTPRQEDKTQASSCAAQSSRKQDKSKISKTVQTTPKSQRKEERQESSIMSGQAQAEHTREEDSGSPDTPTTAILDYYIQYPPREESENLVSTTEGEVDADVPPLVRPRSVVSVASSFALPDRPPPPQTRQRDAQPTAHILSLPYTPKQPMPTAHDQSAAAKRAQSNFDSSDWRDQGSNAKTVYTKQYAQFALGELHAIRNMVEDLTRNLLAGCPSPSQASELQNLRYQIPFAIAIASQYIEATPVVFEYDKQVGFKATEILDHIAEQESKEGIVGLADTWHNRGVRFVKPQ